ncbi:MAG TPA: hypothetical protein VMD98_10220 [Bryocella sp.]|nr:hypothetical protein [Bryocella sp.]
MSSIPSDRKETFTRKSEKESICTLCYSTVRADRYTTLELAEEIHSEVCPMGDNSPFLLRPAA